MDAKEILNDPLIWLAREMQQEKFIDSFNDMAKETGENALAKGFWDGEQNEGEKICLMHSELSECLDALRHGNPPDNHIPEFSGAEAELADTVIRIMDFAYHKKLRLAEAIIAKHKYNKNRPYKHNKKF